MGLSGPFIHGNSQKPYGQRAARYTLGNKAVQMEKIKPVPGDALRNAPARVYYVYFSPASKYCWREGLSPGLEFYQPPSVPKDEIIASVLPEPNRPKEPA